MSTSIKGALESVVLNTQHTQVTGTVGSFIGQADETQAPS